MNLLIVVVLGLALGSFCTAIIHRVPRGLSWTARDDRSACPKCGHVLGPADLIPVFSWIFSSGKCRYCQKPIDAAYPLIEAANALACIGIYFAMGLNADSAFAMLAVPFLIALIVIDLKTLTLPDQLVLTVGVLGAGRLLALILSVGSGPFPIIALEGYLGGAIVYGLAAWVLGLIMTTVLKKDALGFGDVKFFAVAGLWLGLGQLPWFLLLSGILGVLLGLGWRFIKKDPVFPFGPALIAAFYLLLTFLGHP